MYIFIQLVGKMYILIVDKSIKAAYRVFPNPRGPFVLGKYVLCSIWIVHQVQITSYKGAQARP